MHRKSKWVRRLLSIAMVFILLGSVLIGVGIVGGGSFDALNFHISVTNHGLDIGESKKVSKTVDLKDIKHLSIDMEMGEISVMYGEKAQVRFENVKEGEYELLEQDGDTSITVNKKKELHLFNFSGISTSSKVIVMIPKNTMLESLTIYAALGNIEIENIKSKAFDITASMGNLELDHIYSESLYAKNNQGNIDISGTLLNTSDVKNNMGNIDVEIDGSIDDYHYDVDCTLGDAQVNHKRGSVNNSNTDKKHQISIENDMGNIDLNFTR